MGGLASVAMFFGNTTTDVSLWEITESERIMRLDHGRKLRIDWSALYILTSRPHVITAGKCEKGM